jgi:hypothetical protein
MDFSSEKLAKISIEDLRRIVEVRFEYDCILEKVITINIIFKELNPAQIITKLKSIIEVISEDSFISDSDGHEQILDEILVNLNWMQKRGDNTSAKKIAEYVISRAEEMIEQFEEGFNWNNSISDIQQWLDESS